MTSTTSYDHQIAIWQRRIKELQRMLRCGYRRLDDDTDISEQIARYEAAIVQREAGRQ